MRKIKIKIELLQNGLEQTILDREEYFENRSEKWQESEKGETHSEITDKLRDWHDSTTDWLDEIDSLLNT